MSTEDLKRNAKTAAVKSAEKSGNIFVRLKNRFIGENVPLFVSGPFDVLFFVLVIGLLTIGLVMMFSASYVNAKYTEDTPFEFIRKQLGIAVFGVVMMLFISRMNPVIFKKFTVLAALVSLFFLVLVLFWHTNLGEGKEDIKRWLRPPFSFQPSDLGKLGMIMLLAYLLDKYRRKLEKNFFLPILFAGVVLAFTLLVYLESHLSGTILMFIIGITMLFLGGIDKRWFILGGALMLAVGAVIVLKREDILSPYQNQRINDFIIKDYYNTSGRYQINQSLFALGSGGIFGLGIGNSKQKFMYLPEPQNDFVFAIVGEELGFIRCVLIVLAFALLVAAGFYIAEKRAQSRYEKLLVLGISLHIAFQTILNLLVVTEMVPNTGISLPFFSYGGTALLLQLVEMGMVLSVSRPGRRYFVKKKDESKGD